MAFVTWMRALSAVGTVAEATRLFRARETAPPPDAPGGPTSLEAGLANVVVAALKEAFDRDRARFDLDREIQEAERTRAEEALRLEWLRQTATHALGQVRLQAGFSLAVWVVSAVALGLLAPLSLTAKVLLGAGWFTLAAALASGFVAHRHLLGWLAAERHQSVPASTLPTITTERVLPWLLVVGLLLTASSLIAAL